MPQKSASIASWEPIGQHTPGLKVSSLGGFRRRWSRECELLKVNICDAQSNGSAKLVLFS